MKCALPSVPDSATRSNSGRAALHVWIMYIWVEKREEPVGGVGSACFLRLDQQTSGALVVTHHEAALWSGGVDKAVT